MLYAGLELRMGIEARLHEYLGPTLEDLRGSGRKVKEFSATNLLKRLLRQDANASSGANVSIVSEKTGHGLHLEFRPVTQELASAHGKISGVLHFNYFRIRPLWSHHEATGVELATLLDFRKLLGGVAADLEYVTEGTLFTHPSFQRMVEETLKDASTE